MLRSPLGPLNPPSGTSTTFKKHSSPCKFATCWTPYVFASFCNICFMAIRDGKYLHILRNSDAECRHDVDREDRVQGKGISGNAIRVVTEAKPSHRIGTSHSFQCRVLSQPLFCLSQNFPISRFCILKVPPLSTCINSLTSILILYYHRYLRIPIIIFSLSFPIVLLYAFLITACMVHCPNRLNLVHLIAVILHEEYKL
jgi:hypothetical protein